MVTCENKRNEMREIEFNIKFITPLLIGGSQEIDENGKANWKLDDGGLTGKALRGCWRFWFRAIVGGMIKDIKSEDLYSLESQIFGSSNSKNSDDRQIGSKFKMTINEKDKVVNRGNFYLGFRNAYRDGLQDGTEYAIKIVPRKNMSDAEVNVLLATIWVWGNLGAIGSRSRRGFGSPVICLSSGNEHLFTSGLIENKELLLPIKEKFESRQDIQSHLKKGLLKVWLIYKNWIENENIKNLTLLNSINTLNAPADDAPYFILRSYEQISVGNRSFNKTAGTITAVHGRRNCYGMGWAAEKPSKKASKRMSSPVFIRFHQTEGAEEDELFPVVTWCKQKYISSHVLKDSEYIYCVKNFLESIYVTHNLVGGSYE